MVVLAVASWAQYFPVPCNRHYFWAGTPMFIPFFVYIKNLYYYLRETPFSLNKTSFIFVLILLSSILSSTIFEVLDRSLSAVAKINKYQFEIKEPHVLKGVLVESQDTVVQLETINSWLQKIRQRHPDISLIGKDIYNQLFATFLPGNELPGILPSAVFTYGQLEATYKFFKHEKNFILEKRPIIYSGKELKLVNELSDYRLLFRVKFKHALEYQSGHVLFYVHKDLKLD